MARSHEALWLGGSGSFTAAALALLGTNVTLDSVREHYTFWTSGIMIAAYVVGVLAVFCFIGAMREWSIPLAGERPHRGSIAPPASPADPVAVAVDPAVTDRWRAATDDISSELLQLQHNSMSHPGYSLRSPQENPPPSVRIGMMVACSQLDPATPTTSEIRAKFLSFLGQAPVMDLVRELTDFGQGATWMARDDNPRFNFGAVLGVPDSEEAPLAWARLLVPEKLTHRYRRDSRCAYLVLYVEPRSSTGAPASAASLVSWHQRFAGALKTPAALTAFLADQLDLSTSGDPAAEVAVWLRAPRALTELVEVDGFESVAGSTPSSWFMGLAVADQDGQSMAGAAQAWLRQMCDSALHLDGYESALASLDQARPDTEVIGRRSRISPARWVYVSAWAVVTVALIAVLAWKLQPGPSSSAATLVSYTLPTRHYGDGLVIRATWTLGGRDGAVLTEKITATEAAATALAVQFQMPLPVAILKSLGAARFSPSAPLVIDHGQGLVWPLHIPAHGQVVVSYEVDVNPGAVSKARLTTLVRTLSPVRQGPVTMRPPPVTLQSLTVLPRILRIAQGSSRRLTLMGLLSNGKRASGTYLSRMLWKTANPNVATVNAFGRVTGVALGRTAITITKGTATASISVIVTAHQSASQSPNSGNQQGNSGGSSSNPSSHSTPPPHSSSSTHSTPPTTSPPPTSTPTILP